ncbi:RusA family crossover junction endodeoxyribonuclease, partial [Streptococcus agalactiae]|nr:RusA family crossover junction endodeoxyribonuclease [Streptococcus agalactiae]
FINELIWHVKKPDIDNLIKAVFDSISDAGYDRIQKSGIVWSDDNIVCDLRAKKKYSQNPRIKVRIEEIDR